MDYINLSKIIKNYINSLNVEFSNSILEESKLQKDLKKILNNIKFKILKKEIYHKGESYISYIIDFKKHNFYLSLDVYEIGSYTFFKYNFIDYNYIRESIDSFNIFIGSIFNQFSSDVKKYDNYNTTYILLKKLKNDENLKIDLFNKILEKKGIIKFYNLLENYK